MAKFFLHVALVVLLAVPASQMALAEPFASPWSRDSHSAIRLIAGDSAETGAPRSLIAAIEFELKPGFKTYWREPGDAGVPPVFDWSNSRNVAAIEVLWPIPVRFADGSGGDSIGYKDALVLPVRVVPVDPAKPIVLAVALNYAICELMCIPAQGKAQLSIEPGAKSSHATLVGDALKRVPKRAVRGESLDGITLVDAVFDAGKGMGELTLDLRTSGEHAISDMFPDAQPGVLFGRPVATEGVPAGQPGQHRFTLAVTDRPSKAAKRKVTLVVVAGHRAIEVVVDLDFPARKP